MKISILPDEQYMAESTDKPVVGHKYILEDAVNGTGAQNRAFHALVQEYFASRQNSYQVSSFNEFRNVIKRSLGEGFESYVYVEMEDGKPTIKDTKDYMEIPLEIRKDPRMKSLIRGKLKSWSDYTLKQRKGTIDRLIAEMHEAGVNTKKFMEILEGMDER